jgi:transcriptional regulator with PAS, ATPase and Fis domain
MDLPKDVVESTTESLIFDSGWPEEMTLKQILESVERKVMVQAVKKYKKQSAAAAILGVSQPTIARRLKKYNIE